MPLLDVVLLLGAGLVAGFVAGLVGIGGGIIYVPILFFYFEGLGVPVEVLTPLTLGTSLLCTMVAGGASAWYQLRRQAVDVRTAIFVGTFSAVAIALTTRYITTQPWYSPTLFQVLFSTTLLAVVGHMLFGRRPASESVAIADVRRPTVGLMVATGSATGSVSAAIGIGGGTILVPAYTQLFRLPMTASVGTSSATIVLISLAGVISYTIFGLAASVPSTAYGYVDYARGLLLCVPSILTARWGVQVAHYINTRALQWCFAVLAFLVAIRLLWRALSG